MQRKRLSGSLIFLLLFVLSGTVFCAAQSRVLAPDQAIAIIRTQPQCKADSDLHIVREFPATEDGAKLARLAVRTAHEKHLKQFRSGILVRLLNNGGYLVMESDSQTMRPLRLYYLSRAADGRQLIDVVGIQQTEDSAALAANDVQLLIQLTQVFMSELLTAQSYELSDLVGHYFADVPTFEGDNLESYFAVPSNILGFATQQQIEDFRARASAVHLWTFRHALSLPEFAAQPGEALRSSYTLHNKLIDQFLAMKGIRQKNSCLLSPSPVQTPESLKECLDLLREANNYMDRQAVPLESRWIFDLNLSLAGWPFDLGSDESGFFQLAVVPGLIPIWRHHSNGDFKLVAISEDE